jgi:predicted DNA-binding transcriptional regulator YafY
MRADRLLSIILLLQSKGRMSARQLARTLETSVRTIYRDIDALSGMGIPVYGEPGREGGYALLDSYRTSLTGLTEDETRALFMLRIPAPLAELGLGQELRSALLKLAAALPDSRREAEGQVRQRFHLDSNWWHQGDEALPHLKTLYQAVWEDRWLYLRYQPVYRVEMEQLVKPYGLVAKAGVWYLVFDRHGQIDVQRVARLLEARLDEGNFTRPEAFDLVSFWENWCAGEESRRSLFPVLVRIGPEFVPMSPLFFGDQALPGEPDAQGRRTLELTFESFEAARDRLLSLGRAVEVLSPPALRKSIVDYAQQVLELYERDQGIMEQETRG